MTMRARFRILFFLLPSITLLLSSPRLMSKGTWKNYTDPRLIEDMIYRDGELYLATAGGLLVYDPIDSSFVRYTTAEGLVSASLTSMVFDGDGVLWAGTEDAGLTRVEFEAGTVKVLSLTSSLHGLADDRVTSLGAWGDTLVYGTKAGAGIVYRDFPLATFTTRNGLPDDRVNDLVVFEGGVWLGTFSGVAVLQRSGFIRQLSQGLPDPDVLAMEVVDSTVWAGTLGGLSRFDPSDSTWKREGPSRESIFSLHFDGDRLWAGSNDTLYVYDGSVWNGYSLAPVMLRYQVGGAGFANIEVRALEHGPDGTIYLGLGDYDFERIGINLLAFDGIGSLSEIPLDGPGTRVLIRLALDRDGSLWASTLNYGVGKLTPAGRWMNYNPSIPGIDTLLSTKFVNTGLLVDKDGVKWISGINGPIDELRDNFDEIYANDTWIKHEKGSGGGDGLSTHRTIRAVMDHEGNRWFLTDGFSFFEGGNPDEEGINILSRDRSQWLRVNFQSTSGGMARGDVFDVSFDPVGIVYVAIKDYGVQLWSTGGYTKSELFNLEDDLWVTIGQTGREFGSEANILCLELSEDGALWIGTTEGLYRYLSGRFSFIGVARGFGVGLLGANVRDIRADGSGNVWVATNFGVNRISVSDIGDIESFTTSAAWQRDLNLFFPPDVISPLANASCNAVEIDPQKNLVYIATDGGLSALDIASLAPERTELSRVFLYPNPVKPASGQDALRIGNLDSPVHVEVYNLEGELVDSREATPGDNTAWDLLTIDGFLAASGVYLIRISDGERYVVKAVSLIR